MTAMHHIDGYKLLNFASQIDHNEPAKETAAMPCVHPHIALMRDANSGKGSAGGTVIPTIDTVIPSAVGVDIGCGMFAARTIYSGPDLEGHNLADLRQAIENVIHCRRATTTSASTASRSHPSDPPSSEARRTPR
jgi:tRNA-splicing ligase RtcB